MASYTNLYASNTCCGAGEVGGVNECYSLEGAKENTEKIKLDMQKNKKHFSVAYCTRPQAVEWYEECGWKVISEYKNRQNTGNIVQVLQLIRE